MLKKILLKKVKTRIKQVSNVFYNIKYSGIDLSEIDIF